MKPLLLNVFMASTPPRHRPQGPSDQRVPNVQSEQLANGDVCRLAHCQLWEEAMPRELLELVANKTFSEAITPKGRRPSR